MSELDYQYIASLVEHSKIGNSDAFAELYAATYKKLYRFAYQYLKDEYLAQDALQETYILVLKNVHTLKDSKLFISWLNQIHFRVCFNLLRQQARYDEELYDYNPELFTRGNDNAMNPEEWVANEDECKYILQKVRDLPFAEAQVILMKYYHNIKIEEIAQIMDVSRSTVKRYLASGRKKLGQSLLP